MKKLLLVLCLSIHCFGAIALVAHTAIAGSGGVSTFSTGAINTTGSTLCVATISSFGDGSTTNKISDSPGNTWIQFNWTDPHIGQQYNWYWYAVAPITSATHTFTITNGRAGALAVACFSGVTGLAPYDATAGVATNNSGVTTTIQPGSLTPTNNNSLLVTSTANLDNHAISSIDSSFSITDTITGVGIIGVGLGYLVQNSAAAVNPTWTFAAGSNRAESVMAVFIAGTATNPLVSTANTSGFSGGTNHTTVAINTVGANLCAGTISGFNSPTSCGGFVSDNQSNTYVCGTAFTSPSGTIVQMPFWVLYPTTNASHTFTFNTGSSNNANMNVACYNIPGLVHSQTPSVTGTGLAASASLQFGSVSPTTGYFVLSGMAATTSGWNHINSVNQNFNKDQFFEDVFDVTGSIASFTSTGSALNPTWSMSSSQVSAGSNTVFQVSSGVPSQFPRVQ